MHSSTILLPISILLLHSPSPTSTDWTSECMSRYPMCRCTWSSGKRSADCQKSNMNALPVLSNDIQILDMSHNKLTQLQDHAFTNANLINVQKLYLKGCRITKIQELAFNNLRILIEVDLSHNEIEFVDPVIFSTNVRVRVIKLNNNKLHTVREFPVLEYLNTLDLSYNALSNFSHHTFTGLRNLKVLDLSYNQFTNLSPDIFPKLSSLMLPGNQWVCDCELKPLRDYVIANKFFEPELKCTEPLSLYMSPWDGFDELSCKPEILHILANGKIVDSIVALENYLTLSCVVRGDPLPDVKWVKNGRVVQDSLRTVIEEERTVILNLTVGRNDNEFVCVGSNSGGVVERNLTVSLDDAGLSGFVVLKDGVDRDNGMVGFRGERGSLIIYLVIGVVFLSLVVGLIVGGVCVWKWGKVRGDGSGEGDTVVKGVIKDENTKVPDERGDMVVMTAGRGGGSVQFNEQTIITTTTPLSSTSTLHNLPPPPNYTSTIRYQNPYGTLLHPTHNPYSTYNPNSPRNAVTYSTYSRIHPPTHTDYSYASLSNTNYYDYDDTSTPPTTQLSFRSKQQIHPGSHELVYDTVVYTGIQNPRVTQRGVIELPHQQPQQINSPDICDLIVPPPPPPPQQSSEHREYSTPPPPVEFCECDPNSQQSQRNILADKASCLQDFRSRVIMIGGGAPKTESPTSTIFFECARKLTALKRKTQQVPLLKQHTSADDLLDTDRYVNGRPTPDLLINGTSTPTREEEEELYSPGKFPSSNTDNTSLYDNYELLYNKPLLTGPDSLRRYAFLRGTDGRSHGPSATLQRPSSVCSEPRGNNFARSFGRDTPTTGDTVILSSHGYVTLPRRSMRDRSKPVVTGAIKYDNLGLRSGPDGRSNFSLNKCGVDAQPQDPQTEPPHYSNIQQLQDDLYDQLNAVQHPDYTSPLKHPQFDPIPEAPNDDEEPEEQPQPKKYRPVPPPKPKKKPKKPDSPEPEDDGTEV